MNIISSISGISSILYPYKHISGIFLLYLTSFTCFLIKVLIIPGNGIGGL